MHEDFTILRIDKCLLTIIFLLLFPLGLQAQSWADSLLKLKEITVRSTHSASGLDDAPLALSLQTRSLPQMNSDAAISLESLTHQLPGVWINNRHINALGERLLIRGIGWRASFGVRGVQVVLNDIPLTTADGQSVLNIIDPDVIRRVEVVRGPAATYWGNSSGGVLYLSSRPNYGEKNNVRLRMLGGSYGLRKGIIQYHHQFDRHKISAYSSYQAEKGYREYSASRLFRAGVQGSYRISDKSHLEYNGAYFSMPKAENPSALTPAQVKENPQQANAAYVQSKSGKQVKQGQLGLNYYRNTAAGLVTLTSYGIFRDLTNPLPYAIIGVNRWAGGFRGTLQRKINHVRFKGGIEFKSQHDDRHEFGNNEGNRGAVQVNQVENVQNAAAFVDATYRWGDIKFKGGLRYDQLRFETDARDPATAGRRSFNAFSPALGISYNPAFGTIYANIRTSFQAPTTTELVNRPGGGNGFNASIKPEHTLGLELGTRTHLIQNRWSFDIAGYRLWIRDLLFPYQLSSGGAEFYRNQGKTRHSGIEISSTVTPVPDVELQASYNLIFARFRNAQTLDSLSLNGKNVPGIPRHRLNLRLQWSPGAFWMQLSGQLVSSYPADKRNTLFNERYHTVDAKVSREITFKRSGLQLTPFINFNNIFDAVYNGSVVVGAYGDRYFEPAPGRNWRAGISLNF